MKQVFAQEPAFINRVEELAVLHERVANRPSNILFIYGPKSSGKTTLLFKFIDELKADKNKKYEVLHHNLRTVLIVRYQDFVQTFFKTEESLESYGKAFEKEKTTSAAFSLGAFSVSRATVEKLKQNELDPFKLMESELKQLNEKGITPVIIIDELQALDDIYIDEQRLLIKELFNFFVAMSKESHLCHVIIASSDGYFIERIYNDSKLRKTSEFMAVDYLTEKDTLYWLHNLEKESAIKAYTLSEEQITAIWDFFGGSCWEVSNFLDIIRDGAKNGAVPQDFFDKKLEYKKIQMRSYYVDYGYTKKRQTFFIGMYEVIKDSKYFEFSQLYEKILNTFSEEEVNTELKTLVQKNFLQYNPVTAEYALQGSSMEIGLEMFVEMVTKK